MFAFSACLRASCATMANDSKYPFPLSDGGERTQVPQADRLSAYETPVRPCFLKARTRPDSYAVAQSAQRYTGVEERCTDHRRGFLVSMPNRVQGFSRVTEGRTDDQAQFRAQTVPPSRPAIQSKLDEMSRPVGCRSGVQIELHKEPPIASYLWK